jgi:hypothetical protein
MNFYLTLPSNASMQEYPENKQANFTTLLNKQIFLEGQYDVALTEISLPSKIIQDFGTISFKNPFKQENDEREETILINLKPLMGSASNAFFPEFQKTLVNEIISKEFEYRYKLAYENMEVNESINLVLLKIPKQFKNNEYFYEMNVSSEFDMILKKFSGINSAERYNFGTENVFEKLKKELEKQVYTIIELLCPPFEIKPKDFKFILMKSNNNTSKLPIQIDIEKALAFNYPKFNLKSTILEISAPQNLNISGVFANILCQNDSCLIKSQKNFEFPEKISITNYAAIYTDIIDDQYIGDTMAPILQVINF